MSLTSFGPTLVHVVDYCFLMFLCLSSGCICVFVCVLNCLSCCHYGVIKNKKNIIIAYVTARTPPTLPALGRRSSLVSSKAGDEASSQRQRRR